jgi:hypothetical protein
MRHLVVLFIHFVATLVPLLGPGGVRSIVAESLLLKHQLLLLNRSRQRSPHLRVGPHPCRLDGTVELIPCFAFLVAACFTDPIVSPHTNAPLFMDGFLWNREDLTVRPWVRRTRDYNSA